MGSFSEEGDALRAPIIIGYHKGSFAGTIRVSGPMCPSSI